MDVKTYRRAAGTRLRQTREALGWPHQRDMAKVCPCTEDALSAWERGVSLVPPTFVSYLFEHYDVSYDWIYGGRRGSLPHDLANTIHSQAPPGHAALDRRPRRHAG